MARLNFPTIPSYAMPVVEEYCQANLSVPKATMSILQILSFAYNAGSL
jgi:hypothetical protein